jgi:predicted amidohydrolase YtcJ
MVRQKHRFAKFRTFRPCGAREKMTNIRQATPPRATFRRDFSKRERECMSRLAVLASIGFAAFAAPLWAQQAPAPEIIYENGVVLTVDPKFSTAQAVAVRDGRIVAVGPTATIHKLAGAGTRIVDLHGKPMLPGFYDNHIHLGGPLQPWKYGGMIDALPEWLADADTIPKLQAAIAAQVAKTPKGEWIVGEISREEWHNDSLPTRQDFDKVAPDNPVAIGRGPHTLLVNSRALEAAHITATTKPAGGEITRDAKGEPTGKILEAARRVIWDVLPPGKREGGLSPEARLAEWHILLGQLTGLGVTSVNVAGVRPKDLALVQTLYDRWGDELPRMTVQLRVWPGYDQHNDPEEGVRESISEIEAIGDRSAVFHHPKLKLGALKMSIDGGLSAPIFWSTQPYRGRSPDFYGEQRIPDSVFYRVAKRAHELGWQIGIHTMGDAAAVMVVDQLERILTDAPRVDHRDYLHHVAVLPPEATLDKMGALHINVASQPGFLLALGSYADEALSSERAATQDPSASLLRHGIRVSYGSDAGPYGPISAIYAAVTRKGWNGVVHGAGEAVSVQQALTMHTLGPAYFTFDEKTQGSIEPGKVADFVVLSANPMTIDPERIQDVVVERTIIGGREVYARPAAVGGK